MVEQMITSPMIAIGTPGPMELILIVLVILIFFGAKRLPELARGLGKGIREFRGAMSDTTDKLKNEIENAPDESKPDDSKLDNSKKSDTSGGSSNDSGKSDS
jgi:sec-independent protein translocase protein TatA